MFGPSLQVIITPFSHHRTSFLFNFCYPCATIVIENPGVRIQNEKTTCKGFSRFNCLAKGTSIYFVIHDDTSLTPRHGGVIPGLTKPAPYLIRGNPVRFWIPAGVYPVLDSGREWRAREKILAPDFWILSGEK
jgi:hypothetical protein